MNFFKFADLKKRFTDILYDVSIGLVKDYQKTAVDIAKIEAASFYVKLVQAVRRQCFLTVLVIFGLIVYANVMGILQAALLLYAPWPVLWKVAASIALGLLSFTLPLCLVLRFFSEERWMKITKADACVSSALEKNGSE